jgi:hypothetical protein
MPLRPELRGGQSISSLNAGALADYSGAARVLFSNIISPAALLAGGLVPLGFLAAPLPGDKPLHKKLRCIYSLLSVVSLSSELMAIVYATVAANKLTETTVVPAASAFALIQRDYELSWIATNVHFLFGLFGFLSMIGLRAYTIFPKKLNHAAAGIVGASLLGMCSVVNRGVSAGDASGSSYGNSILSLVTRYGILLTKQLKNTGGIMSMTGIALGIVSTALAVRAIFSAES